MTVAMIPKFIGLLTPEQRGVGRALQVAPAGRLEDGRILVGRAKLGQFVREQTCR
jgi:hypothetical protein